MNKRLCDTFQKWNPNIWEREQMKSLFKICPIPCTLPPGSHQGHISFSFKLHWKWKEWDSTQPAIAAIPVTLEYIGIHLKCNLKTFEIEGACSSRGPCHLILLQRQQRAFQKTPFGFLSQAAEFTPHRKTMTMSCREFKICISEQCEQVC